MSNEKITMELSAHFGKFLNSEDQASFISVHTDKDFVGYDDKSGIEYFGLEYFKGYVQSYMSVELEDAGYWTEE